MRHLISLKEQTKEDILTMLSTAKILKAHRAKRISTDYLHNMTLIMLFEKSSTRTRLSFEAGMTELGGHAIFLDKKTTQFSLTDFHDEIQAVMRFGHVLMFRANSVADVETAASFNTIPVIDACSEKYHPAQALSDILTMDEASGGIEQVKKIAWLGVENNVSNTLMLACTKLGIEVAIAAPEIDESSVDSELRTMADATGLVSRTANVEEAISGADYIHTDTWMNMEFLSAQGGSALGGEQAQVKPAFHAEYERRKTMFSPFQLNASIVNSYAPHAKIMHCMPCHVGYEISRDAIDHPNSIIFDQAENRLHMQKAIILWLLEREGEVVKLHLY